MSDRQNIHMEGLYSHRGDEYDDRLRNMMHGTKRRRSDPPFDHNRDRWHQASTPEHGMPHVRSRSSSSHSTSTDRRGNLISPSQSSQRGNLISPSQSSQSTTIPRTEYPSLYSLPAPGEPFRKSPGKFVHDSSSVRSSSFEGPAALSESPIAHHEREAHDQSNQHKEKSNAPSERKVSCLECRSSKVRCSGRTSHEGCDRCKRLQKSCVFEQHRRGRKPTQIKMHKLEQSVDTIMSALNVLSDIKGKSKRDDVDDEELSEQRRRIKGKIQKVTSEKPSKDHFIEDIIHNSELENRQKTRALPTAVFEYPHDTPATNSKTHATTLGSEGEDDELGLPPLSNPLKLLAQASDATDEMPKTLDNTRARKDLQTNVDGVKSKGRPGSGRGVSQRDYWSIGMYSSRYDIGPKFDPITCGILDISDARKLFSLFMRHLNERITLLDPVLHTFEYVRSYSALLLSASCALAARFCVDMSNAEEITNRLDTHIQDRILPTVLLQGLRSVEISQAYMVLAAYHANTQTLNGDRSWSLLGWGIRIAAELDMNSRLLSEWKNDVRPSAENEDQRVLRASSVPENTIGQEEITQRRLRNRERTWCNLWLFEYSLSTQMGRRSTLAQDPVILGVSSGWHRASYAIKGDEAIVALIALRRIQIKQTEFFEHSVMSPILNRTKRMGSEALRFQLEYYRQSCSADIHAWSMTYEHRSGTDSSLRMKSSNLYASYTLLILYSYALKSTTDAHLLDPLYKESYSASMTYLSIFSEGLDSPALVYIHNSAVVTLAYVAVFSLRLCSLDSTKYPYIDTEKVFTLVGKVAQALGRAGAVTPWRNGAASSYAPYLQAVLDKVKKIVHKRRADLESASAFVYTGDTSSKDHATYGKLPSSDGRPKHTQLQLGRNVEDQQYAQQLHHAAQPLENPAEPMGFVAGPSGVQTGALFNEGLSQNLSNNTGSMNFDWGSVDPFTQTNGSSYIDGSIFGDMSVLLDGFPWGDDVQG